MCRTYHDKNNKCYVQAMLPKGKKYQLVFFDFESETRRIYDDHDDDDENSGNIDEGSAINSKIHIVNTVCATYFCDECLCSVDIDYIQADFSDKDCQRCCSSTNGERRMKTFITGVGGCEDALEWFVRWLFTGIPGGCNRPETTYVIGHYAGRFLFVLCGEK